MGSTNLLMRPFPSHTECILKYLCNILAVLIFFGIAPIACNEKHLSTQIIDTEQFINLLESKNDTFYIVNFWRTTCKPHIHEMPYYEKADLAFSDKNVKILLISLDQGKTAFKKIDAFKEKYKITTQVVLLNAPQYSLWLEKADPDFWGTTPATLIFNKAENQLSFINR